MAETLMPNERLVCVGTTALRNPDGSFLPSHPLYIKVDESLVDPETKLSKGESGLYSDIAEVLLPMYERHKEAIKQIKKMQKSSNA